MTKFRTKPLLSLLLALVMVLTMLTMSALAAEAETPMQEAETVQTVETAKPVAEAASEEAPAEETTEAVEPAAETEPPAAQEDSDTLTGTVGESAVVWTYDVCCGRLIITGSGNCQTFTSPDDQPWAAFRENIREVWFDGMETLAIENLAYWFDGCTELETAEVPYTTPIIGRNAFANCPSLYRLMLYHTGSIEITDGAFSIDTLTALEIACIVSDDAVIETLFSHDWSASNRAAFFVDVYGTTFMATGYCAQCKKTCSYTLDYEQWTSSVHCVRHWCSNCGTDQAGGVLGESHSFSGGVCTKCGYNNGSGGSGSGGGSTVCYHTSTRTTWSGCDWYEYCRNCGELVDSGTSHGTYVYGSWEYYNSSRHRRYYYCSDCGEGSYTYGYHSTATNYAQYSTTQHSVTSYCATCDTNISTSYASHSFSYGSWQNYSGTQHRRLKTCSVCGYSEYEYSDHSLSYGVWTNYSASQHRRTVSCSTCGYSTYEYASHSLTNGTWTSISDTQHQRTNSCSCGYSTTETASHTDADGDGYCDGCGYLLTHFSATVPASLTLTVSEHGEVYAATNAAVINNSTGAVEITTVTVSTTNGWTLVPYSTNLASEKVDSKQIGFSINGAVSSLTGTSEALSLDSGWTISSGASLPLIYDAVVSATSTILNEQVLTVVFVIEWQPE
ncbi:MAG: hypothetical protein PHE09_08740 [Oscillospiraceae bacterium]|nr:hypothetical protein [Oscillospiraceae bacterium]